MCSQKQIVRLFLYQNVHFGLAMKYCVKICWKTTTRNSRKLWQSKCARDARQCESGREKDRVFGNVVNERFSSTHLFNKIIWSEYKSNLPNMYVCTCAFACACMCECVHIYVKKRSRNVVSQPMTEWIEKPKIIERTRREEWNETRDETKNVYRKC